MFKRLFWAALLIPFPLMAEPEISCEIPNDIRCTVSDPAGFQRVLVQIEAGIGTVTVVDARFPTCQTEAMVSWDPIVPNFDLSVTDCKTPEFTVGQGRGEQIHVFAASNAVTGRVPELRPLARTEPRFVMRQIAQLDDLPVFAQNSGDGDSALLAGCGHPNVFCGPAGGACLVESSSEQASCPGTVENNPGLGAVCNASC